MSRLVAPVRYARRVRPHDAAADVDEGDLDVADDRFRTGPVCGVREVDGSAVHVEPDERAVPFDLAAAKCDAAFDVRQFVEGLGDGEIRVFDVYERVLREVDRAIRRAVDVALDQHQRARGLWHPDPPCNRTVADGQRVAGQCDGALDVKPIDVRRPRVWRCRAFGSVDAWRFDPSNRDRARDSDVFGVRAR